MTSNVYECLGYHCLIDDVECSGSEILVAVNVSSGMLLVIIWDVTATTTNGVLWVDIVVANHAWMPPTA